MKNSHYSWHYFLSDDALIKSLALFSVLKSKLRYLVPLMMFPVNAYAIEDTVVKTIKSDPMSGSYLIQLVVGLLIVIVCIIVLAWMAKKMNRFQSSNDESLKILASLSMGSRERVVLLQIGQEQVVIGVSPGQINTLHVLKSPIEKINNKTGDTVEGGFADKLKTMIADVNNATGKKQNRP